MKDIVENPLNCNEESIKNSEIFSKELLLWIFIVTFITEKTFSKILTSIKASFFSLHIYPTIMISISTNSIFIIFH